MPNAVDQMRLWTWVPLSIYIIEKNKDHQDTEGANELRLLTEPRILFLFLITQPFFQNNKIKISALSTDH